ncbi:MAG: alpha/beta fold hydrolase [Candidatus Kapabacteria bacterium]|nr:alpha/beta fold hydrolase [Candidatus Kapabacteria bacterium]
MLISLRRFVLICTVSIVAVVWHGCSSVVLNPKLPTMPAADEVQQTTIAYPILLLHGLGQKSHAWDGGAVQFYEKEMGLRFGGTLSMKGGAARADGRNNGIGDFYTVSFSVAYDSVNTWARELEQYVNYVRQKTKAEKVILIGYSMGGLASRRYLTQNLNDHHVKRLITIGTPHLGSPFAKVWNIKTALTKRLADKPNIVSETLLKGALATVTAAEADVPFDSPAVGDLRRPEDGGSFLDALGKAEHPGDVDYICVIGDVDVMGEVSKFNTSAVQEVLRRALEFMDSGDVGKWLQTGDGVVSAYSQTMTNIPFFKNSISRQRLTRTVTLGSLHTDHLQRSNEIQRVTLEDKPEFKSAEFYAVDGKPALVVEFNDYLPPKRSTVTIQYPALSGERTVKTTDIRLVRKKNGEVVSRAIVPLGNEVDFGQSFTTTVGITNYFNNSISTTKEWRVQ